MSDIKDVLVPDLGEDEVEVIELCVSPGDSVEAEDALVTVESDKASMDVPAPFAGTLKELCVKVGDKISHNDLLAKLEVAGEAAAEAPAEEAPAQEEKAEEAPAAKAEEPASAPAEQSSGGSETIEVTVPDIGDAADVDVIEILVSAGDSVEAEDGLITLETDKATMDVPSPKAGKVVEVKVKEGDKVSEGSLVLILEVAGSGSSDSAPAEKAESAPAAESALEAAAEEPAGEEEIEVTVPDIGDASDVDVIEILVAEGDTVAVEDGLITLETDKATMDVPSPKAGVVTKLLVKSGDKVSKGDKVCMLKVAGSAKPAPAKSDSAASAPKADSAPAASKPAEPKKAPVPHHPSAGTKPKTGKVHASPSVRRLAREFGVDLSEVPGSGPKNRILKEDVQAYVKEELSRPRTTAPATGSGNGGGL